jgi:putative flippase GtrA
MAAGGSHGFLRKVRPKNPLLVTTVGVADPSQAQDDIEERGQRESEAFSPVSGAVPGALCCRLSCYEAAAALIPARTTSRLRQFGGWFVLGVAAFGAEVVLLGVLHQWLKCPLWLASAVAAECVLLARFLSTDRLVFGYPAPSLARCGRFHGAAVGSFAVSWVVLNGTASGFGVPYVAAAFLGSVAAFAWSGLTNFLWVWRSPQDRERLDTAALRQTVDGSSMPTRWRSIGR